MPWPVFADELDLLARRLRRLPLGRTEEAIEGRSELAHELLSLATRIRKAAGPVRKPSQPVRPAAPSVGKPTQGTIRDRRGNVISVDFRARRRVDKGPR